jgi:hypothetical protein
MTGARTTVKRWLARRAVRRGELVVCGACASAYVNPVAWEERGDRRWWIRLRCGECGARRELVVDNDTAQRFDRELDRGVRVIAAVVERLESERMEHDAETLATALRLDLISPGDFAAGV